MPNPGSSKSLSTADPALLRVSASVLSDPGGGVQVLVVAIGEIDISTVGLLRTAALRAAVTAGADPRSGRSVRVELDWRGVRFLDSSALHLLHDLYAAGRHQGWTLGWLPPTAAGPANLLRFAADHGWLPAQLTSHLN